LNATKQNIEFRDQCQLTTCAEEQVWLHKDRAMYWPVKQTLLLADVHLGKEQIFNRHGHAIPEGPSLSDIQRIEKLVTQSKACKLVVLGDLVHARPLPDENWLDSVSSFLDRFSALSVEVVTGNHDRHGGREIIDKRIRWHNHDLCEGPFVFRHEPKQDDRGHVVCGHIHPCYRLSASRRESLRAPVFWLQADITVLPSFGEFTGGHTVKPNEADRVYMVGPESVIPVHGTNVIPNKPTHKNSIEESTENA